MRYYFYKGPVNLKNKFPDSTFTYPLVVTNHYILYNGQDVEVMEYADHGWRAMDLDPRVDSYIQRKRPEIISIYTISQGQRVPTTKVGSDAWLSIMF